MMKKVFTVTSIITILMLCACENQNALPSVTNPSSSTGTNTPTLALQTQTPTEKPIFSPCLQGDSGENYYSPATATPTWLEYKDDNGNVFATISRAIYYDSNWNYCNWAPSSDFVINIERGGQKYLISAANVLQNTGDWVEFADGGWFNNVWLGNGQDSDGDNEIEIPLNLMTRGTYCCTTTVILYYDPSTDEYRQTNGITRKYTLQLEEEDVDNDGYFEYITNDVVFNQAVGGFTPVNALSPIQIYEYSDHQLVDATTKYPARVEKDAEYWLESITNDDKYGYFALSAYMADLYVLGRQDEANAYFDEMCPKLTEVNTCPDVKKKFIDAINARGY
jgi:hypothetical protein